MTCSITADINFDNLVKVMPDGFFQWEVTIFPFAISKYFTGRYSETYVNTLFLTVFVQW